MVNSLVLVDGWIWPSQRRIPCLQGCFPIMQSSSACLWQRDPPGQQHQGQSHLGWEEQAGVTPAVPCWHPWLQAGLTSAGWLCVLQDKARLWNILPMESPAGLFADRDKGWRGLGRTWGRGSCATP